MDSSLTAGTEYGTVLVWAIILGAALKFVLTEGLGRWFMATKSAFQNPSAISDAISEGWTKVSTSFPSVPFAHPP